MDKRATRLSSNHTENNSSLPEPKKIPPIKKQPEERFEYFWDKVSDMRIFYFGTALVRF